MPARPALCSVLLFPLLCLAQEPGPAPRKARFDKHGYLLPAGAVARLGVPTPLTGLAWSIAWSADGRQFVVSDRTGVAIFDAATGRPIEAQLLGEEFGGLTRPLSRYGRLMTFVGGSTATVYDTATAAIRRVNLPPQFADEDRKVYSLSLSADCRFLAGVAGASSRPGVAWRYDFAHDRFTRLIKDRADLISIRLSPDGKRIYATAGTVDPELTARDVRDGRELWTVPLKAIGTLRAVSGDGRRLAVTDNNGISVFDAGNGRVLLTMAINSGAPQGLWGIDLSDDGTQAVVADGLEVVVWDVATGKAKRRIALGDRLVAFSPDGKSVLTASAWVQRWDIESGKPAYAKPNFDHLVAATHLKWSGEGKRLLSVWPHGAHRASRGDVMAVWDVGSMTEVWRGAGGSTFVTVSLDSAGSTVRGYTRDRSLRTWRLGPPATEDAKSVKDFAADTESKFITFLADGRLAVQSLTPFQAHLNVYGANDQALEAASFRFSEEAFTRASGGYGIGTVLIRPNGRRVDLLTGRPLPPLGPTDNITQFSADMFRTPAPFVVGRISTNEGGPRTFLWESLTGRIIRDMWDTYPGVLSPDGRRLAYALREHFVVRDLAAPDRVSRFPSPEVSTLEFSPDGQFLASAHPDGTVLIWEVPRTVSEWVDRQTDRIWDDLAGDDAGRAWKSLWHLLDHPDRAAELLRGRLRSVPVWKDTAEVIARLDHPKYSVREDAVRELARRGAVVEGDLVAAKQKTNSAEQRERLQALLDRLNPAVPPSGETLRGLRCIWLLERIGTADARKVLSEVATGASGSRVTMEAKAALERLGGRPK